MKIKHQELDIPKEEPFENCKLDRRQYALVLTDIVNAYADGFVLAINNEWGTGKTTFIKMWQQHLCNESFKTIYFNAWENDFDSNPLAAIMSELDTLTNSKNKAIFKSVIEKGAALSRNILPALLKAVAKKYIDSDVLLDGIKNTADGATKILEEEIKEYAHKKKTIIEFRDELEKFVKKEGSSKPLVFIIDELDRCRPDYAVEVLELMKHFFSVPGIIFVLSIDKVQLGNAIRGFYGSDRINADEYLRRFIDLEYSIPRPSDKVFSKYLFDYYSYNEFFSSTERLKYREFHGDGDLLLKMAVLLFNKSNATLRQQEKIFGQTRLTLCLFQSSQHTFPPLLFVLVYIKTMKSELYSKIERNSISLQELSDAFADLMPSSIETIYSINLIYVEALLLHFYNNNQEHTNTIQLFETDSEGKFVSPIISKLENEKNSLANCLSQVNQQWHFNDISLKYLLKKINLTEPTII